MSRASIMAAASAVAFQQGSQRGFNKTDFVAYLESLLANVPVVEDSSHMVLFQLIGANMTLTTDQPFVVRPELRAFTNFVINGIVAVRKTGAFGTACAGGIYSGAAKAGNAWVAAAQSWAGLTGAAKIVKATLGAVAGTDHAVNAPVLSLTTGNTGALTADLYLYGQIVD